MCTQEEDFADMSIKRRRLEDTLNENVHVVACFSCITALEQRKLKRKKPCDKANDNCTDTSSEEGDETDTTILKPGISFWVAFDWPQYGLAAFEEQLSRGMMMSDLDIESCTAIRGRGNLVIFIKAL